MTNQYKALIVNEKENNTFEQSIKYTPFSFLKENDILIKVEYSGINYKDALSFSGNKGITRNYPHTPGIDAAGKVIKSNCSEFNVDDEVIVTGYDLGMNTNGGLAEYISVPHNWVVKKPINLSLKECMIIGTSGFTAANAVYEVIQAGILPADGKVIVSGAAGAVGSMAVAMFAKIGFSVIASSGKSQYYEWLKQIGANEIIGREDLNDTSNKPLLGKKWIAGIDTVGGLTLDTIIRATADYGVITNCGMITSNKLNTSVFPFILRGIRLIGIASAETEMKKRLKIWQLISDKLLPNCIDIMYSTISLYDAPLYLSKMLKSEIKGKIIVEIN